MTPSTKALPAWGRSNTDELLLGLALLEVDDRDVIGLGEAEDVGRVGVANFSERCGRGIEEPPSEEEAGNEPGRLKVGDVRLKEDPVDAPAGERDPIPK
jgi:hypothetical protein